MDDDCEDINKQVFRISIRPIQARESLGVVQMRSTEEAPFGPIDVFVDQPVATSARAQRPRWAKLLHWRLICRWRYATLRPLALFAAEIIIVWQVMRLISHDVPAQHPHETRALYDECEHAIIIYAESWSDVKAMQQIVASIDVRLNPEDASLLADFHAHVDLFHNSPVPDPSEFYKELDRDDVWTRLSNERLNTRDEKRLHFFLQRVQDLQKKVAEQHIRQENLRKQTSIDQDGHYAIWSEQDRLKQSLESAFNDEYCKRNRRRETPP